MAQIWQLTPFFLSTFQALSIGIVKFYERNTLGYLWKNNYFTPWKLNSDPLNAFLWTFLIALSQSQLYFWIPFTFSHLQIIREFLFRENCEKQPFLVNFCLLFFVANPLKNFSKFLFQKIKFQYISQLFGEFQSIWVSEWEITRSWILPVLTFSLRKPL